jgi:hypothetical protein
MPNTLRNPKVILFTRAFHWFISLVRLIKPTLQPSPLRTILISFHLCLGLPSGLFHTNFPSKTLYAIPCYVHLTILDFIILISGKERRLWSSLLRSFLHPPVTPSLSGTNIYISTLFSVHPVTQYHDRSHMNTVRYYIISGITTKSSDSYFLSL